MDRLFTFCRNKAIKTKSKPIASSLLSYFLYRIFNNIAVFFLKVYGGVECKHVPVDYIKTLETQIKTLEKQVYIKQEKPKNTEVKKTKPKPKIKFDETDLI